MALTLNMFYNTGIATYVWVLTNRKPSHRQGRVQLIDATKWFTPLRPNLGQKNCELSEADIDRITGKFMAFEESEQSKIFPNAAFGYWKVTVERPLRVAGTDPERVYKVSEISKLRKEGQRDKNAPPIVKRAHLDGPVLALLHGLFAAKSSASQQPSSTNPTRTCGTPSRYHCWRTAASTRSCDANPALRGRRLVHAVQPEGRLRNQLQPPLLQTVAYAEPSSPSEKYDW